MRFPAAPSDEWMHLNLATDDGQIRVILTFEGRLDACRIARATELTLADEPVLRSAFVERSWRSYWEPRDPSGAAFGHIESADELSSFMAEPATPGRPPQVQVRLHRADRDVLCVRISHLVVDGSGALDYIGKLAGIYRMLVSDGAYQPRTHPPLSRDATQVLRYVSRSALARALTCRPVPAGLNWWGLPSDIGPSPAPVFLSRRIGVERMACLQRLAKSWAVGFTELLLTAYFRALFLVLDPPTGIALPVAVPVNLRRYLPSGNTVRIANLTGALLPAISREHGTAFAGTLAQVHAAMETARASHPELAQIVYGSLAMLPGVAVMRRLARRFHVACPSFANLGAADPSTFEFGNATVSDVASFGPVLYPPAFGISINTFGGAATVTTARWGESVADLILDQFLRELPA